MKEFMIPNKQALTANCLVNSILKHSFKYWTCNMDEARDKREYDFSRLLEWIDYKASGLIGVIAPPAMGKTSFFLDLAFYLAKNKRKTVYIFSYEEKKEELVKRLMEKVTELYGENGRMMLKILQIFIINKPYASIEETYNMLSDKDKKDSVFMIDGVKKLRNIKDTNEQLTLAENISAIEEMANDIPVFVSLSTAWDRNLPDGDVEKCLSVVLSLYRDSYYDAILIPDDLPIMTRISVLKNKRGCCSDFKYEWTEQKRLIPLKESECWK